MALIKYHGRDDGNNRAAHDDWGQNVQVMLGSSGYEIMASGILIRTIKLDMNELFNLFTSQRPADFRLESERPRAGYCRKL